MRLVKLMHEFDDIHTDVWLNPEHVTEVVITQDGRIGISTITGFFRILAPIEDVLNALEESGSPEERSRRMSAVEAVLRRAGLVASSVQAQAVAADIMDVLR